MVGCGGGWVGRLVLGLMDISALNLGRASA